MRLDEMLLVHPQMVERRCGQCFERVGIYPSGQMVLGVYPDTVIVCHRCAGAVVGTLVPGAELEPYQSMYRDERRLP